MAMAAAAALIGGLAGAGAMLALRPPSDQGAGVRAYLLAHPEVLPEAMERLQAQQNAALVAANRAALFTPFPGAVAGNPKGDVTLAEFYDYACGYCRAAVGDVDRLVAEDKNLRVVFKEMPVLSELSDSAARLSLAAAKAGRFAAFHHALYAAGPLDTATLAAATRAAGIAPAAADAPDIAREVEATMAAVRAMRFSGTPTFVVGDQILPGAVGYAGLKAAVAAARAHTG
ncbi:DsbA family protein [Sphingomonas morindae]|uniref:Thioredoxin domain-containing protein n=1 Tax=Sphingomonas morindae TaxID=1541170 RepID=A0ABY4XA06_9SPHN|nr:thioredoxin domain-containing protein [Sphingomonas morindae]USI73801.1 thioredoxin domain-containing protein [Sphingomonas morindae]